MANEDEIADVYKDYLEQRSDGILLATLGCVLTSENLARKKGVKFEDYERTQIISMIQNLDWSGEHDPEFEDQRRDLVDGNNYRCPGQ